MIRSFDFDENVIFLKIFTLNTAPISTQYFGNIQNMATQQIVPSPYYFSLQNYQPLAFQQQQFYQQLNTAYLTHQIPVLNIANNATKAKKKAIRRKNIKK